MQPARDMAASVLGPSAPENPVEYSRPLEIEASELQRVWTKTRHNGPNKRSSSYKKISVLTLSWRPDIDDLGSQLQDEVNRLSDTFRNEFNYPVTNYQIGPNRPQSAVNYKVAKFVHKNSGPGHLLVIYYAGHGRPGEAHGELYMIRYVELQGEVLILIRPWVGNHLKGQPRTRKDECGMKG